MEKTNNTERDNDGLAVRGPDLLAEPAGMTTGQKLAVGVGVTGATGVAGFALYRLGVYLGWWGRGIPNTIIIDGGARDKKDGSDSKDDKSSSGGSTGGRASGRPPNTSGDKEGYNTTLFPHPGSVRLVMILLGYKVEASGETLVPNNKPNPEVARFQRDWNKVIRGLDSGKVKPPPVHQPALLKNLRGLLDDDGIPGKNTLNGLEHARNVSINSMTKWLTTVGQA